MENWCQENLLYFQFFTDFLIWEKIFDKEFLIQFPIQPSQPQETF